MTYDAREISITGGEPIKHYEIRRGVDTFRFTSAAEAVTLDGFEYTPVPIESDEPNQTPELSKAGLKIRVARNNPVAELFRLQPPGVVVSVTIFRSHRGETDKIVWWMGRILRCEWTGVTATLDCESAAASRRRPGLRRKYGPGCPHVLYGLGCNVSALAYRMIGTVSAISDNTITVGAASAQPDDYYIGGYVQWQSAAGEMDSRMIFGHTGSLLTLMFKINGVKVGDTIEIYPGCNRTLDDCINKFAGNEEFFGGFPFAAPKNPFTTIVF